MRQLFILLFSFAAFQTIHAQKFFTRSGNITFLSEAPLEKIEAVNKSASSVLDPTSGKLEFAVLIKAFQFEKALMQEHFNENYMESSKFPKAVFKGEIADKDKVNFSKPATYEAIVKGNLTIHGVTKPVTTKAVFEVSKSGISAKSQLTVLVADYGIEIPAVVKDNVAKEVKINILVQYEPLSK